MAKGRFTMAVVLRRGMTIGAMAAEDDLRFLSDCFIETGQAAQLVDIASPRCIALGRTGSGKSALLIHIEQTQRNFANVDPEDLSLRYISNSDILRFFEEIDVNLDVFYQLLWRHVLVVELLKLKKEFHDKDSATRWFAGVYNSFAKNPKRQAALAYLTEFNGSFWLDTEKRIRQVVDRIEDSLQTSLGMDAGTLRNKVTAMAKSGSKQEKEETSEIINRAQKVVSEVQIQELNELMKFLSEDIFSDRMNKYYLLIDDLDRGWVHDAIRFKLIRALIETIRKFRKISNVKIVISLRADLFHMVMNKTEGKGFQSEKFDDLMLRIKWSRSDLKSLVESRINEVFKDQYTGRNLKFEDIFTSNIGDTDPLSYMLDRSLYRPRDLLSFVNQCFEEAEVGASSISARVLRKAETEYSNKRLLAIADEWREAYGDLEYVIESLGNLEPRFSYRDLTDDFFEDFCLQVLAGDHTFSGRFAMICNGITQNSTPHYHQIRKLYVETLYIIGAIGVKRASGSKFEWSFKNEPVLNPSILNDETRFCVHPMLHRRLNMKADGSSFNVSN